MIAIFDSIGALRRWGLQLCATFATVGLLGASQAWASSPGDDGWREHTLGVAWVAGLIPLALAMIRSEAELALLCRPTSVRLALSRALHLCASSAATVLLCAVPAVLLPAIGHWLRRGSSIDEVAVVACQLLASLTLTAPWAGFWTAVRGRGVAATGIAVALLLAGSYQLGLGVTVGPVFPVVESSGSAFGCNLVATLFWTSSGLLLSVSVLTAAPRS